MENECVYKTIVYSDVQEYFIEESERITYLLAIIF